MAIEEKTEQTGSLLDMFSEENVLEDVSVKEPGEDIDEVDDTTKKDEEEEKEKKEKKEKKKEKNIKDFDEDFEDSDDLMDGKDGEEEEEDEEGQEDVEEESIWSDVEKLTGWKVDVEWGDVDPETPEGVAKYIEGYGNVVRDQILKQMEDTYPRAYQLMIHEANGGDPNDLFDVGEPDYSAVEFADDGAEQSNEDMIDFLNFYYTQHTGLSDEESQAVIERIIQKDELYSKASSELKKLQSAQETKRQEKFQAQAERAKELRTQDLNMANTIKETVDAGTLATFNVPQSERATFTNYVLRNVQRSPQDPNKYVIVQEVDANKLEGQLQALYFAYKEGDLSKIVQRRAKTENARRLKRNSAKDKPTSGTESAKSGDTRMSKGKLGFEDFTE